MNFKIIITKRDKKLLKSVSGILAGITECGIVTKWGAAAIGVRRQSAGNTELRQY